MKYRYWLARLDGIGNATKRRLLSAFKSSKAVFEANMESYEKTGILKEGTAEYVEKQKESWKLSDEYEAFKNKEISLITYDMEEYPESLRVIHNSPFALYYKGSFPGRDERLIAVVGARRCSAYGRLMAEEIGYSLAGGGFGVVSGMALGVDGASHRGCIRGGGKTYAVLGCGVDVVYPGKHKELYQDIIENGGIISDYPPGTPPIAEHFPSRNRIIAGLSQKTVVVEARVRSGSLITADFAMEQGKDVLALPGRVTDVMSEGTNRLIAQGAGIIRGTESLLADLKELGGLDTICPKVGVKENIVLEKEELLVYSCLDFYAKGLEEVMRESKMELLPLLSALMRLGELGLVKEIFKNKYIRLE